MLPTMPGRRALSQTKRAKLDAEFQETWVSIAAEQYNDEKESGKKKPKSMRAICHEVEKECYEKTGRAIKLPKSTVADRASGKESLLSFNARKKWLTADEEEEVIDFAINSALRGFPLNHQRLREHVNRICRGRNAPGFPESGVGKEWTQRCVEDHREKLKPY